MFDISLMTDLFAVQKEMLSDQHYAYHDFLSTNVPTDCFIVFTKSHWHFKSLLLVYEPLVNYEVNNVCVCGV